MPYNITEEKRTQYRESSRASARAKSAALAGKGPKPVHPIYEPRLDPTLLMPALPANGLRSLSLFSGGGGLDLGFERAGYGHVASYDILDICGETLRLNRPTWQVLSGAAGDVTQVDWDVYAGKVDLVHGGPPCQPFSVAGYQLGYGDRRNMWPEFVRAVLTIRPRAFVAENVPGLLAPKFSRYVSTAILQPLREYKITSFQLHAAAFGVPQSRQRVFFVGIRSTGGATDFRPPEATHSYDHLLMGPSRQQYDQIALFDQAPSLPRCMGVREALGLPAVGTDGLAPTLRSGFTGPRNSTSVLNSVASQRMWAELGIWPNGVAASRERASMFVAKDGHFRMSVQDCALIQGFPLDWIFAGGVYKTLGQIGNSVAPPMAYAVAKAVARALLDFR
ncbi:MAG TPA: DNA (cytosine-5-)-methyltransferase [Dehalococcoidia bacterium]|nr:DNA (cytosine-5-)-methyltransferase [Dehalococcoidia bacterium]